MIHPLKINLQAPLVNPNTTPNPTTPPHVTFNPSAATNMIRIVKPETKEHMIMQLRGP
jgi:hypothetical protein